MRVNPVLAGLSTYPFVRLPRPRRPPWRVASTSSTSGPVSPRGDSGLHPPGPGRRTRGRAGLDLPGTRGPARATRGDRRLGRAGASAPRWIPRPRSCPRWAPRRRSSGSRRSSAAAARASRSRRPATPSPSAGRCSPGAEVVELALRAQAAGMPDLDAVEWDGVALLWLNYPNNPTAVAAHARAATSARRALARAARLRARRRRGLQRAVVRRRGAGPAPCSSPTAPTCWWSTRCPSARRCPDTGRASSPATPS